MNVFFFLKYWTEKNMTKQVFYESLFMKVNFEGVT